MKVPYTLLTLSAWQVISVFPCFVLLPMITNAFVVHHQRQPASIMIRTTPWTTTSSTITTTLLKKKDNHGHIILPVSLSALASSAEANGFVVSSSSEIIATGIEGEGTTAAAEEELLQDDEVLDSLRLSESSLSPSQTVLVDDNAVVVVKDRLNNDDGDTKNALMEMFDFDNPSITFARGLILVASAVYGTNFAMVKMLDEQMPYTVSASLRFGLAAVVVTSLVLRGESSSSPHEDDDVQEELNQKNLALIAGMEIGGWYCLGYLCQALGLQTVDASKSAFFNALAVIVVPLLDSFFRGKRMGVKGITSVALAILGVGLIQLGPSLFPSAAPSSSSLVPHFLSSLLESSSSSGTSSSSSIVPTFLSSLLESSPAGRHHGVGAGLMSQGDAFCLGQAALFGIGYWRLEEASSHHPTQAGRITVGQLLGVALGSIIFCILSADVPTLTQLEGWLMDPFTVGALVWTALVSTALALYLETVALKAVSATELTVLMTSVSLFGSAFAFVTMGETMTPIGMAGGLLILAGCVFSSFSGDGATAVPTEAQATSGRTLEYSEEVKVKEALPVEHAEMLNEEWLSDTFQIGQEGGPEDTTEVIVPTSYAPSLDNGTSGGLC